MFSINILSRLKTHDIWKLGWISQTYFILLRFLTVLTTLESKVSSSSPYSAPKPSNWADVFPKFITGVPDPWLLSWSPLSSLEPELFCYLSSLGWNIYSEYCWPPSSRPLSIERFYSYKLKLNIKFYIVIHQSPVKDFGSI